MKERDCPFGKIFALLGFAKQQWQPPWAKTSPYSAFAQFPLRELQQKIVLVTKLATFARL